MDNATSLATVDWAAQARSFDTVAEAYEAYRPGYPQEMVAAVISSARLTSASRILEIGSGTGKATEAFVPLGCSILCVEPGANLAAVAERKFRAFPGVRFQGVRFEDCELPVAHYDLVMSAQAFHWVPADAGLAKAAACLKPGGCLALFWNSYPGMTGDLADEIQQAYTMHTGWPRPDGVTKLEADIRRRHEQILSAGLFTNVRVLRFPWTARYSTQQYLGLLGTYSDHLALPQERFAALKAAIAPAIDRHGGFIDRPYVAALHLADR